MILPLHQTSSRGRKCRTVVVLNAYYTRKHTILLWSNPIKIIIINRFLSLHLYFYFFSRATATWVKTADIYYCFFMSIACVRAIFVWCTRRESAALDRGGHIIYDDGREWTETENSRLRRPDDATAVEAQCARIALLRSAAGCKRTVSSAIFPRDFDPTGAFRRMAVICSGVCGVVCTERREHNIFIWRATTAWPGYCDAHYIILYILWARRADSGRWKETDWETKMEKKNTIQYRMYIIHSIA